MTRLGPLPRLDHAAGRAAVPAEQPVQVEPPGTADDLIVEHARIRIQGEIDWHERLLADIDTLTTPA